MEEFERTFQNAVRNLKIADHMTYVTYPLINEKRLLLKIFDEIYKSIINSINTILNYEYHYKKIQIYKDNKENLSTFINKSAKRFDLSYEQIKRILEIIHLNEKHKQSSMEFVKKDRIVILGDNLSYQILDIQRIKEYLLIAKELLMKTKQKIYL
ncbi:MAG: hypothetical protein WC438_03200 [Candidatus Pacearchaeota archaeon]